MSFGRIPKFPSVSCEEYPRPFLEEAALRIITAAAPMLIHLCIVKAFPEAVEQAEEEEEE